MACWPSGLVTWTSYRPYGAPVRSNSAMISVPLTKSVVTGWYSANPGMTSLTIALGWNWAPVIVVVTYWLSPPWSVCTFVIDSGSNWARMVTGVSSAGSELPSIST